MVKDQKKSLLSSPALLWLLEAIKGKKRYVAVETLLQVLVGLGHICYSLLFREMIDRAVEQNRPGFFRALSVLVVVAVLRILLRAGIRRMEEFSCAKLENTLKERLFGQLLRRSYADVTAVHTAQWMNRLTSDTVVVANGIAQIIPNLGGMAVKMVGAFCVIMIMEPIFGFLVIPGGALLILVSYFVRPAIKRLHGEIQESDGQVRVLLQERLDNLLIVNAYSQQEQSVTMAREAMADHRKKRMKRNLLSNINQVGFGFAMQGMYLAAGGYCAWGILSGTVTYGTMTAMLQMISHLQSPFSGIGGYVTQWYGMISSAERLMAAEKLPEDQHADQADPEASLDCYQNDFRGIGLDKLVFSYVERSSGHDLAVTIHYEDQFFHKGEFIALAGPSGCGKSTLLKLLMHVFRPDSGEIYLSGETKRPITSADRGLFAYVPQGNMLMSGSVRQILAFYDQEAMTREAELREALRIACALEFVDALPQGIDTVLGEHGAGLSEGQIQRIAVARAIFSRRPILLLDEATSALDEKTEETLLDNLKTMTDRMVLIVTHRPRACQVCDRVIYMQAADKEEISHDGKATENA